MLCCEDGCGWTAIYMDRCADHVMEYRRKYPYKARRHDEAKVRAEKATANAHGKNYLHTSRRHVMAKAKTLKPTMTREGTHGRIARWEVSDGVVEADRRGVHLGVDIGRLEDVEELGAALKAAHRYYLNVKETV